MKRGATKEDIIRTTQALIVRNGIRAVRVDEIAQALGISKRTLYETFVDKATLINRCLEDISSRQKRRV
ncbi:MAG: helix-turn-helix domain-containing protein, partial [Alistipes sp.]